MGGCLRIFEIFSISVDRRLLPEAGVWVCLSLLAFLRKVGPPTLSWLFVPQFLKTRYSVVYRSPHRGADPPTSSVIRTFEIHFDI